MMLMTIDDVAVLSVLLFFPFPSCASGVLYAVEEGERTGLLLYKEHRRRILDDASSKNLMHRYLMRFGVLPTAALCQSGSQQRHGRHGLEDGAS